MKSWKREFGVWSKKCVTVVQVSRRLFKTVGRIRDKTVCGKANESSLNSATLYIS
jgi:hypothetical protein